MNFVLIFRNIKLKAPYEVQRDADKLHFTYLDTVGRPVVTLHKDRLVEQHIQDFEVVWPSASFLCTDFFLFKKWLVFPI